LSAYNLLLLLLKLPHLLIYNISVVDKSRIIKDNAVKMHGPACPRLEARKLSFLAYLALINARMRVCLSKFSKQSY